MSVRSTKKIRSMRATMPFGTSVMSSIAAQEALSEIRDMCQSHGGFTKRRVDVIRTFRAKVEVDSLSEALDYIYKQERDTGVLPRDTYQNACHAVRQTYVESSYKT